VCQGVPYLPYRWSLTRVKNIFGKELTYTYTSETKQISYRILNEDNGCSAASAPTDIASYPVTITYPGGRYRVRFQLASRNDYPIEWQTDAIHHSYERSRLQSIIVEQDADGNGSFETIMRRYDLSYTPAENPANLIWPNLTYTAGGKVSTLSSVRHYGLWGAASLAAYTFT
jgi:hypothetical protein